MTKIGVMSDSHSLIPKQIYSFFEDVDLILHCGDIGSSDALCELRIFKPTIAVWGNCDSRYELEDVTEFQSLEIENTKILMTHIGGYPKHYPEHIRKKLQEEKPDIFLCGHSHILKIIYDKEFDLLHINPGACGRQGFHLKSTLVKFCLDNGKAKDLDIMEFEKNNIK